MTKFVPLSYPTSTIHPCTPTHSCEKVPLPASLSCPTLGSRHLHSAYAACAGRVDPAFARGRRSPSGLLAQPKSATTWQVGTPRRSGPILPLVRVTPTAA